MHWNFTSSENLPRALLGRGLGDLLGNLLAVFLRVRLGDGTEFVVSEKHNSWFGGKLQQEKKMLCDATVAFLLRYPVGQSITMLGQHPRQLLHQRLIIFPRSPQKTSISVTKISPLCLPVYLIVQSELIVHSHDKHIRSLAFNSYINKISKLMAYCHLNELYAHTHTLNT